MTDSTDFPTNQLQFPAYSSQHQWNINTGLSHAYPVDVFVAELNSGGSNLIYSTYLGGTASDAANGIALDSSDNAYVTGFTYLDKFSNDHERTAKASGLP